jgi:hypothetical protein
VPDDEARPATFWWFSLRKIKIARTLQAATWKKDLFRHALNLPSNESAILGKLSVQGIEEDQ